MVQDIENIKSMRSRIKFFINKVLPTISLIIIALVGYSLSRKPHEFSVGECSICHIDEKRQPMSIKTNITSACDTCHTRLKEILSHPTDIYPSLTIPKDMPLTEGRLTCITCHNVHQREGKRYFLRREVKGPFFCSSCHKVDEKGHVVLEKVHTGTYAVTDRATSIDRMSLECIECHSASLNTPADSLGAGIWSHYSKKAEHPIGVSYERISTQKMRNYRPLSMLPKEIRLFNGKIGCGTCHNIYSKEPFMLVLNNFKSRLCLECHIK